jgi:hypothetical protein
MMDLTGNSPEVLADDLRNLRILNRYLSGSRSVMLAWQWGLARKPLKHMWVLDVGTGSADIPAAISAWAKRRNIAAKIVGVEADPITARRRFRPALSIGSSHRSFYITSPRRK